jgi:rare lipoprotein A (peptidoglycan hydrolase)
MTTLKEQIISFLTGCAFVLALFMIIGMSAYFGLERLTTNKELTYTPEVNTAVASWYGHPYHGRVMANGDKYDMHALTFAHKDMPFGTRIKFTRGDKTVIGICTDRGPFVGGRMFDLSYAMACSLEMVDKGVDAVRFEVVE